MHWKLFLFALIALGVTAGCAPATRIAGAQPVTTKAATTTTETTATTPTARRAVHVALGTTHGCVVRSDGTVACWGTNEYGQLGDGTRSDRPELVQVSGLTDARDIVAAHYTSCAVLADGHVACWGVIEAFAAVLPLAERYPCGSGYYTNWNCSSSPIRVPGLYDVAQVVLLDGAAWALHRSGWVECFGLVDRAWHRGTIESGVTDAQPTRLVTDGRRICALTRDHTIRCRASTTSWPALALTDVARPALLRNARDCAVRIDGSVACVPSPFVAVSDDVTWTEVATALRDVVQLEQSGRSYCALRRGGTVECWGANETNQIGSDPGDGYAGNRRARRPRPIAGLANIVEIAVGEQQTCAIDAAGALRCLGYLSPQSDEVRARERLPRAQPVPGITQAVSLCAGEQHACAVLSDGTAHCWGANFHGQLGDGTRVDRGAPVAVQGIVNAVQISCQSRGSCALLADHTVKCWGDYSPDSDPRGHLVPTAIAGLTDVEEVADSLSAGTCARKRDGTVWCWRDGELAPGGGALAQVPGVRDAVEVKVGSIHACARRASGAVACWGFNFFRDAGQLGTGEKRQFIRREAKDVPGLPPVAELSLCAFSTAARLTNGEYRAWGAIDHLPGKPANSSSPVAVPGLRGFAHFYEMGQSQRCALTAERAAHCWGRMGNWGGLWVENPTPVRGLEGVVRLVGGSGGGGSDVFRCGLLDDGTVRCSGANTYGQLGTGEMSFVADPVRLQ